MKANFFQKQSQAIEQELLKLLETLIFPNFAFGKKLFEAAYYALFPPGKHFRPLLLLAIVASYEKALEKAYLPACALEMIHTYSLIHDDLPSMDNDDIRRGKPSLHKAFPEWLALLVGDFFLTAAFEACASAPLLTDSERLSLIKILAQRSGARGMIAGQVGDLFLEGKEKSSWKEVEKMEKLKTGALILGAVECGALLASIPDEDKKELFLLGEEIGLGFQIANDLQSSSDLLKKKKTAYSLLGEEKAKELAESFLKSAQKRVKRLSCKKELLEELIEGIFPSTL